MKYFMKVGAGDTLSNDSLNKYGNLFFSNIESEPHISHYEALKGSNKYNIIEDKQILNSIIELYESKFSHVIMLDNNYTQYIQRLASFIEQNARQNEAGTITNGQPLLRNSRMHFLLAYGKSNLETKVIPAHEEGIKKCNDLSQQLADIIPAK